MEVDPYTWVVGIGATRFVLCCLKIIFVPRHADGGVVKRVGVGLNLVSIWYTFVWFFWGRSGIDPIRSGLDGISIS